MYSTTFEKRAAFKTAIKGLVDLVYEGYGKDVPIVFAFGFMTDENYMDEVYKELAAELTNAGGEAYYVRMPTCRNALKKSTTAIVTAFSKWSLFSLFLSQVFFLLVLQE